MIDLDEMVKRNRNKDFTTPTTTSYAETHHIPTPHTLEEYNAVVAKIAPVETKVSKAPKEKRKFHFNKRLLIVALILGIVGASVGVFASNNTTSATTPCQGLTPSFVHQTADVYAFVYHNGYSKTITISDITTEGGHYVVNLVVPSGQTVDTGMPVYTTAGWTTTIKTSIQVATQVFVCTAQATTP